MKQIPTKQINDKVKQFLDDSSLNQNPEIKTQPEKLEPTISSPELKKKSKGRSISMTDDFDKTIDQFLKEFPDEGSRSQLIQRSVIYYMKKRRLEESQFNV